MRIRLFAAILLSMLSLTGCGGSTVELFARQQNHAAEVGGSPFRWKSQSIPGGGTMLTRVMIDLPRGTTKADDVLKNDILSRIKTVELSKQRNAPEVEEVRLLPDGREVWVLKNKAHGVAYIVMMKHSPLGGTNLSIAGPEGFQKG